jgi:two-component system sensor histidine kinase UhpB
MLLFCAATLATITLIVGHSLRFLSTFTSALQHVADGRYQADLPDTGPPEFAAVAQGFNRMVERLRAYQSRNMTLQDQISTVQEEERAEVARDLHDEVGPHLFAVNVDADAIRKLAEQGRATEISERAVAIGESVMHIQKYVKAILRQLRPSATLDFGLRAAVSDLVAFWQRRHPAIRFDVAIDIDDAAVDRSVEDAAYRIVQESISNAIRHGQPTTVLVSIAPLADNRIAIVIADDGGGLRSAPPHGGAGLAGMAERARALRGTLTVANRRETSGVEVSACLPCRTEREMESVP